MKCVICSAETGKSDKLGAVSVRVALKKVMAKDGYDLKFKKSFGRSNPYLDTQQVSCKFDGSITDLDKADDWMKSLGFTLAEKRKTCHEYKHPKDSRVAARFWVPSSDEGAPYVFVEIQGPKKAKRLPGGPYD